MKNIIVVGASAGGILAVKSLISGLQGSMDAAFFIVQHLSRDSDAQSIVEIFQRHTSLSCKVASDGMIIEAGHVYLAPPDHHLVLNREYMGVTHGTHENKYRPSIDVLFRSAAVTFGNRVIGIILSGMLEDGTSGMSAVKKCGGRCIVQNPKDAEFLSMPQSVLNNVKVDYQADLVEIPALIYKMLSEPLPEAVAIPKELEIEAGITMRMVSDIDQLALMADRSDFVCPDCGGGLWSVKNDVTHRYRCHTGHVYTEKLLEHLQQQQLEESVWVSIRMLEEKSNLLKVMAARQDDATSPAAKGYARRISETNVHIDRLKKLLGDLTSQ
jgi:two-component system chemotaxis response regulator CheB